MKGNFFQAITGGIVATVVITIIGLMAPYIGLPKMSPPELLSGMLGVSTTAGWILHFIIGIILSISYAWFFIGWVQRVNSKALRGLIFGFAVFVFAQIMLALLGAIFPMPESGANPMLMMIGSLIGHLAYGLTVGLMVTTEKKTSVDYSNRKSVNG